VSTAAAPAQDDLAEVAPDVLRLRQPLDEGIDHVNLYLIRDRSGWLLFDTGVDSPAARAQWERLFAGPLSDGLSRIVVSHHHPDHLGSARWLHERSGAPFYLRPEERTAAERTALSTEEDRDACRAYFEHHGMEPADAAYVTTDLLARFMACDTGLVTQSLEDGEVLDTGRYRMRVLVQGGHSVAQIGLFDAESDLLFTGDQLLERITPNLSLLPWGDPRPLHHYLRSLEQTAALAPRRVLPAHHRVYHTGTERARGLIRHHERALQRFRERLREGMRGMEVAEAVYGRRREALDRFLALTETLAHLQYLEEHGEVRRDDDSRWHFRAGAMQPTYPTAAT
jgi:glyoxylase-like metal-dependent hydrolase (beta-lactamase superfamily II)